jgi:hypothetical protein
MPDIIWVIFFIAILILDIFANFRVKCRLDKWELLFKNLSNNQLKKDENRHKSN